MLRPKSIGTNGRQSTSSKVSIFRRLMKNFELWRSRSNFSMMLILSLKIINTKHLFSIFILKYSVIYYILVGSKALFRTCSLILRITSGPLTSSVPFCPHSCFNSAARACLTLLMVSRRTRHCSKAHSELATICRLSL